MKFALEKKKKREKAQKPRHDRRQRRDRFVTSLFILPSFLGVALFFLLPFLVVGYYALIDNPIRARFVGLSNFAALFSNTAFKLAARNTAVFSAISVPLAVVIPLAFAVLLMRKIPAGSFFKTVLISPLMVPTASVVLIWEVLFHYNGTLNTVLTSFGLDKIDFFKSDYAVGIIVCLFLWKNIGYNMILFMSALANIPVGITEACMLDGAGPWKVFFRIKIPYISSSILFVTILSLINSFKIFREIFLMTGKYPYEKLYMLQHFMNNTFDSLDYQKLSAAAIVMCAVMIVIIGILFLVEDKVGRDIE
ncbi:MAG: sugar ABC transporter permease [Clostridia bacterium]|nr:sugar ABC transporter permease [Clostridia bacterium]